MLPNTHTDYLILQAGSEDISNLDTLHKPEENLDYFREKVTSSAKNLLSTAESSLQLCPNLKKVVIMDMIPRYDPSDLDPLNLKPNLVHVFNSVIFELWMTSVYKDKIFIGHHNLQSSGSVREARFRDSIANKYDGVHMFGPPGKKAFTISTLAILKVAGFWNYDLNGQQFFKSKSVIQHPSKQSSQNIRRSSNNVPHQYSVPTHNRFEALN